MKQPIPRQMFEVAIQADIGAKIVARKALAGSVIFTAVDSPPLGGARAACYRSTRAAVVA